MCDTHLLSCVCGAEPESLELQEAISKGSFQHEMNHLEAGTSYLLYLKAYSPLGASQQSRTVVSTTLGGGKISNTTHSNNSRKLMFEPFRSRNAAAALK